MNLSIWRKKQPTPGGIFSVALAGGSTPLKMYTLLSDAHVNWSWVHIFWGDERCLPPEDKESNYHMANEALLKVILIPKNNIHRIRGELPAGQAAKNYENDLHQFFGGNLPRFNLVLLGLGKDGHTASLFPGAPALGETSHWVAPVPHRIPPPPLVDRVTLTPPVLNAASHIIFLVSGAEKAKILERVLHNPPLSQLLPAEAVKPVDGTLLWLLDKDAAAALSPQHHGNNF